MSQSQHQFALPRSLQFALALSGLLWIFAAHAAATRAASGLAIRFDLEAFQQLLEKCFMLFLLLVGFAGLHWVATRSGSGLREVNALSTRPTAWTEWKGGAALGWAMLLLAALPLILAGDLHPQFWFAPRAWGMALISLATLGVSALTAEVAFRGYVYRRLLVALGPTGATVLLSVIYAVSSSFRPHSTTLSVFITFLMGLLFSVAYLRTHALWLGWGLHCAWNVAAGVLLGLPVAGLMSSTGLVESGVFGSTWFTGGFYGPEGALLTVVAVLVALLVLYPLTRDYAWAYTHPVLVPGAYAVVMVPPAAHTAMEQAAVAAPAPLVQILSSTSMAPSTLPVIEEHLRKDADAPAE